MKDIKNTLYNLLHYYDVTRQRGHTTLMMEGAKDKDCLLFCHTIAMGERLKKQYRNKKATVITPGNIDRILRGNNRPIAIDNAVMYTILSDSLAEICRLEEINRKHWDITEKKIKVKKAKKIKNAFWKKEQGIILQLEEIKAF